MASYEEIKRRLRDRDPERIAKRANWFLLGSVAVTLTLYLLPHLWAPAFYIGLPLIWLSTLVHELGHGLTASMLGASFEKFVMFADASGAATWAADSSFGPLRRALVAAGGLVGPAIVAAVGFVLARKPKPAQISLLIGLFALAAIAVLVVRNAFGLGFVAVLGLIIGFAATRKNAEIAQITLVFLSTQLAMSVFSRGDYLFTEYADTAQGRMPSDVAQMADALVGPYWLWGGLVGLFSVLILGLGLWLFFKGFGGLKLQLPSFLRRSKQAEASKKG